MKRSFCVVGHRGSPEILVENTLPSFERAVRIDGANGIELDLCVTEDHEVVVWHDADPREGTARLRRWGLEPVVRARPIWPKKREMRRPVSALTLAELREHYGYAEKLGRTNDRLDVVIPKLADVFEWATSESGLECVYLDVKIPDDNPVLLQTLLETLDDLVAWTKPSFDIVLETASPKLAADFVHLAPRFGHALDIVPPPGILRDPTRCSGVRAAVDRGLDFVALQRPRFITFRPFATYKKVVAADLARMRQWNASAPASPLRRLCAFTINEENEMRELIDLGVRAMQTDRPALLRGIAEETARQPAASTAVATASAVAFASRIPLRR